MVKLTVETEEDVFMSAKRLNKQHRDPHWLKAMPNRHSFLKIDKFLTRCQKLSWSNIAGVSLYREITKTRKVEPIQMTLSKFRERRFIFHTAVKFNVKYLRMEKAR